MGLLSNEDREVIRKEWFNNLQNNVEIIFFEKENCQTCETIKEILNEISELDERISFSIENITSDKASEYNINKGPALVIKEKDKEDKGVRFYGLPAGHEFVSFLHAIKMFGEGNAELNPATIEKLQSLDSEKHIQVFVTLSCPYCPSAVITAHKMAYVSDKVKADMVNAEEFYELSNQYGVSAVPRVVINENHFFEGALPEEAYIEEVLKA